MGDGGCVLKIAFVLLLIIIFVYFYCIGYTHSAYTFGMESHISHSNIDGTIVPSGALITLLHKGVQYTEAEISIGEDGTERVIDSLSLIDSVMPDVVDSRKQAAALQQAQQATSSSSTGQQPTTSNSVENVNNVLSGDEKQKDGDNIAMKNGPPSATLAGSSVLTNCNGIPGDGRYGGSTPAGDGIQGNTSLYFHACNI